MKSIFLFTLGLVVGLALGRFVWWVSPVPATEEVVAAPIQEKPVASTPTPGTQEQVPTPQQRPEGAPAFRNSEEGRSAIDPAETSQRPTEGASSSVVGKVAPKVTRRQLEGLVDKEQIDAFLQSVRQDNLFDTIRSSTEFRRVEGALAEMEGRFIGEVTVPEKRETWEMTMEGRFRTDGSEVSGRTRVILARNGKVFSRHAGNGKVNNISSISGGVLVQASPTSYFQLYYLPRDHTFVGNYYEQGKPGEMLPKGVARLSRE